MIEKKLSIREEIAFKQWLCGSPDNTDTRQGWNEILNRDYWLKQAGSIIHDFAEYVQGCELTDEETFNLGFKTFYRAESTELFAYSEGVNDASHATISKVMEGLE